MRDAALHDELIALAQRIDDAQQAAMLSDERETLAQISALLERNPPAWEEARPLHEGMKARQAALHAAIEEAKRAASERLRAIVVAHGWPGEALVGADGAFAASRIVQRANHDLALQRECLALLEAAVAQGDVPANHYAWLYDRVAVQEGRPQRYGTEMNKGEPYPIEDIENLDARRTEVGLEPFGAYKAWMDDMLGRLK